MNPLDRFVEFLVQIGAVATFQSETHKQWEPAIAVLAIAFGCGAILGLVLVLVRGGQNKWLGIRKAALLAFAGAAPAWCFLLESGVRLAQHWACRPDEFKFGPLAFSWCLVAPVLFLLSLRAWPIRQGHWPFQILRIGYVFLSVGGVLLGMLMGLMGKNG